MRQKELELALRAMVGDDHPDERGNGLKADLRVAADAIQGGWENVSEVGAQALSKWLESTKDMVIPPKDAKAAHKAKA